MRFGSTKYGYKQWRAEQRILKLRPEDVAARLARDARIRQRSPLVLTPVQWERITEHDLPDNWTNDKRRWYREVYLKSEHWVNLRARKLEASPVCEVEGCGSSHRVEPHHLRYKNIFDVELEDLKTLCRRHHVLEHKRLNREKILATKGLLEGVPQTSKRPP